METEMNKKQGEIRTSQEEMRPTTNTILDLLKET
jgi:hypothetical protein